MLKNININGKEYKMASSAYTIFAYKNFTGRDLLKDAVEIEENTSTDLDSTINTIEKVLQMAYVMNHEADSTFGNYDDFLRSIDVILTKENDVKWMQEVLELATHPFQAG